MQRFKHPIRAIREPFGKAGLTVAICALVMAMVGGAYAAGGLTKSQEKQVTKIAKKFAGKPGAPGAPGAAGTNGTNGTNGKDGANGAPGSPGKSVVASAASGTECTGGVGGTKFEVEGSGSPSHLCNGKNGTTGFTEFLPSGETEKGSFAATGSGGRVLGLSSPEGVYSAISFNIPLEVAPTVHVVTIAEVETQECPGGVKAPAATAGSLCIFLAQEENILSVGTVPPWGEVANAGKSGPEGVIVFALHFGSPGFTTVSGSWAVTAE